MVLSLRNPDLRERRRKRRRRRRRCDVVTVNLLAQLTDHDTAVAGVLSCLISL